MKAPRGTRLVTRREVTIALLASGSPLPTWGESTDPDLYAMDQLTWPPLEALSSPELFGYSEPNQTQKNKAAAIVQATPKGPSPFDIAQSFVDRFFATDPATISQWPAPSSWNPLVVEFFSATTLRAANDMIAWCAAFANWCLDRAGRNGSRSAASQSFLDPKAFQFVNAPKRGDLAVFTCYDKQTKQSVGLGHVAFFKEFTADDRIAVIGGNQSSDGHSSIISEAHFKRSEFDVRRQVGGRYVACTMKINQFIRIV
jgi:uncharacterized protein (TIGR02594 family)